MLAFPRQPAGFRLLVVEQKMYVASAFDLVVRILRQKTLDVPFFQTEDFQLISAWISGFSLSGAASTNSRQLLIPLRARQNQIERHFLSTTEKAHQRGREA